MGDTLFDLPAVAVHDPGGKVKTALPAGLRGDAEFSDCGRYRRVLRRWIGASFPDRHWLLIGMNPSTADADFNDNTINREWGFTVREGYNGFVKCNVGDYRATCPADLSKPGVAARSLVNLRTIIRCAVVADRVVACWGRVPKPLANAAAETLGELRRLGIPIWCFGTNGNGSPKHPLYLPKDTPLVPFAPQGGPGNG